MRSENTGSLPEFSAHSLQRKNDVVAHESIRLVEPSAFVAVATFVVAAVDDFFCCGRFDFAFFDGAKR